MRIQDVQKIVKKGTKEVKPAKKSKKTAKQEFKQEASQAAEQKAAEPIAQEENTYLKEKKVDFSQPQEEWLNSQPQPILLPQQAESLVNKNQQEAMETFKKASSLVRRVKPPSEVGNMRGRKLTPEEFSQVKEERKKLDELKEKMKVDINTDFGIRIPGVKNFQEQTIEIANEKQRKMIEAARKKNPPPNKGVNKNAGGNSTAGQADNEDQPGFFQKHWKATAATVGVGGLAACVGIANMMLAGGQQSNSNLYNPYQQQY